MKQFKYILTSLLLIVILCSGMFNKKPFVEYKGGRFLYSGVLLKLYSDSTYYYYEWSHTGRSIRDNGTWNRLNEMYFLNSATKTRWVGGNGKSDKILRFEMQEFIINGDTLKFIPKESKEQDYYNEYYKLLKVPVNKQED